LKRDILLIETPEKIIFTYNIAEIGTRAIAYIIDSLIQIIILILLLIFAGLSFLSFEAFGEDRLLFYIAILYIMFFFFQWGYFMFFETIMNGKTPGKKICRIRVIRYNGERLDFQSLVIRNLLRAADSIPFPFFNILGGLVAIIHKQNKRLGDIIAGTVVVSDTVYDLSEPDFYTHLSEVNNGLFTGLSKMNRLSEKDLYILRKLINERPSMPEDSAARAAKTVVSRLEKRFDISMLSDRNDFEIIETIYKAHTYENKE